MGCGFGMWWICGGWGVVSCGGVVVAWGYGLWILFVSCVRMCVCFFSWWRWVFVAGVWWFLVVCLCVCSFFFLLLVLTVLVGGFGGFFLMGLQVGMVVAWWLWCLLAGV